MPQKWFFALLCFSCRKCTEIQINKYRCLTNHVVLFYTLLFLLSAFFAFLKPCFLSPSSVHLYFWSTSLETTPDPNKLRQYLIRFKYLVQECLSSESPHKLQLSVHPPLSKWISLTSFHLQTHNMNHLLLLHFLLLHLSLWIPPAFSFRCLFSQFLTKCRNFCHCYPFQILNSLWC